MADRSARANRPPPRWLDGRVHDKPVRIPLTLRRIVDAAFAVVDAEGLGALTIRRLATELGVAPMSLYSHVTDKAELVDIMVDVVIGEVLTDDEVGGDATAPAPGDWVTELRDLSRRYQAAWAAHQSLVRVYADGVTLGPNGTAMTERFVAILRAAGFSDAEAVQAFWLLYHYTIGSLQIAPPRPTPGRMRQEDEGERGADERAGQGSTLDRYFSARPLADIPNIVEVVDLLAAGGSYDFGLETILSGLVTLAAGRARPAGELSEQEVALRDLLRRGWPDEVIARELGVTPRTIRRRTAALASKLGVAGRAALVAGSARP